MNTSKIIAAAIAMAAFAPAAHAAPAKQPADRLIGVDARIPFADSNGIRNYHADGDRGLWIEDVRGRWYRAELFGPCQGLNFANKIGFVTKGTGTLDRFGQILVDGRTCQLQSLVTSNPPPKKIKKAKKS